MTAKIRIFISSVQKELELERAAMAALITTDSFLSQHCTPVLFEKEPPPPRPSSQPYLDSLRNSGIYVLLIANEYGRPDGKLSATHHEYRLSQDLHLPTIIFIKGATDDNRSTDTIDLIAEIKEAGHTYKRFHDREDLKPEMLRALMHTLTDEFAIEASSAEICEGEHQIESASPFETFILNDMPISLLHQELIEEFSRQLHSRNPEQPQRSGIESLHASGLAVCGETSDMFLTTAAGFILFGSQPAHRFPQCEILVDAYDDIHINGRPIGQLNVNAPLPHALVQVMKFIDVHTFHPRRVVGLNNIRLDEYPLAALREVLLNAVAHRSYDDASRKIFVRIYSDRIEVASPGYPLKPLTLAKLRRGGYRPCSRNPLIAQSLAILDKMEQRGSGFARMKDAMLDHGLDVPQLDQQDGFFVVTLYGPNGNYDRLMTPIDAAVLITPAMEARLNDRQKRILQNVQKLHYISSGWCRKEFGVTYDTANRDLLELVEFGLLVRVGRGRGTRFQSGSGSS
jgi:ATP-dependent DNA helicase RecG